MGLRGPLCVALAAALLLGAAGWAVTDRLEQDDDFCNACHVSAGVPLHIEIRRDFDARPTASLAAAHAVASAQHRADGVLRCIDCHGGTSWLGRTRVKTLAAKDALLYLSGRFEEPEGMRWPLWDEDCRKCHAGFAEGPADAGRSARFHELAVHNAELGVDCVECHVVHQRGVDPAAFFLDAPRVRAQCARCHSQFE
jgi:hypothetical protein